MTRLSALGKGRRNSKPPALQYSDGSSSSESPSDEEYVEGPPPSPSRRLRGVQNAHSVHETPPSPGQESHSGEDMKAVAKGGVSVPFPWKLHEMLDSMSRLGFDHIVCWQPHGRAFMVHKPKEFVDKIMHNFFNQTKYASFQRQLNLYGFSRLSHGRDKGAYYHTCFVRSQRNLCRGMVRQKIKGTKVRRSLAPEEEPNFYLPCWSMTDGDDSASQQPQSQPRTKPSSPRRRSSIKSSKSAGANEVSKMQGVVPISPTSDHQANQGFPLTQLTFPTMKSLTSARSPSPLAMPPAGPSFPGLSQTKPATDALWRMSSRDQSEMTNPSPWTVSPAHASPFADLARGGDLLFFEGQPFRYLEHMEGPSSVAPMMNISSNNIAGLNAVTPSQREVNYT